MWTYVHKPHRDDSRWNMSFHVNSASLLSVHRLEVACLHACAHPPPTQWVSARLARGGWTGVCCFKLFRSDHVLSSFSINDCTRPVLLTAANLRNFHRSPTYCQDEIGNSGCTPSHAASACMLACNCSGECFFGLRGKLMKVLWRWLDLAFRCVTNKRTAAGRAKRRRKEIGMCEEALPSITPPPSFPPLSL